ncbi:hypothetical protein ACQJBY_048322 [Aegilops geniculata]
MGKSEATPTATKGEGEKVMVLTTLEVDPATEDPDLLDAIRKKNSAALTSILDPRVELSAKDSSNAAAAVWYFVMNGHHITGNLNLLTDLTPVCDRWVRSLIGTGPPMQVCARGSVNCNGIKLDDVCAFSLKRPDGTVVGKGRVKGNLYEVDFLDISSTTAPWYIVSNAAEHMTGNLHLLSNFTPTQPGRQVRTHTGAMLQVRGKGSLSSTQLSIPSVSYVPGLTENIISVTQLTDSGFSVAFSPHGCTITRNRDGKTVGCAYHAGGQLYRLDYLRVADSK